MDTRTRNVLSICSGVGGIELGLHAALDGRSRTVCYVENEISVASILAARMEDGSLDSAPIWTDLKSFSPEEWRGKVDILAGGFPCQPHSVAGSQLGEDDPRELSGEVLRIADGLGLPDLFLENVPGILRFYWDNIRPELRKLGYSQIEEGLFTASETGAPHRRERLFILADTERNDAWRGGYELEGTPPENQRAGHQRQRLRPDSGDGGNELADTEEYGVQEPRPTHQSQSRYPSTSPVSDGTELADTDGSRHVHEQFGVEPGQGRLDAQRDAATSGNELADTECIRSFRPEQQGQPRCGEEIPTRSGNELADTDHEGLQGVRQSGEGEYTPESRDVPLYPPGPNDHAGWQWLLARWPGLAPTYCKEGHDEGHDVQPEVPTIIRKFRGASHRTPTGVDRRLRAIGNGVVPIVAATAYRQLTKQLEERKNNAINSS